MLLIDIGNSRVKVALKLSKEEDGFCFTNVYSHSSFSAPTLFWQNLKNDLEKYGFKLPEELAISSVKPSISATLLESDVIKDLSVYYAKTDRQYSFLKNSYQSPEHMGVDRWLAMIAGSKGGTEGCLIVDAGTAMTLDFVNNEGEHIGGYINVGMYSQLTRLLNVTEQVVAGREFSELSDAPGQNTHDCVINGILEQARSYIIEQIRIAKSLYGICQVIFTGGDAEMLFRAINGHLNHENQSILLRPELVLEGLYIQASSLCKKI